MKKKFYGSIFAMIIILTTLVGCGTTDRNDSIDDSWATDTWEETILFEDIIVEDIIVEDIVIK